MIKVNGVEIGNEPKAVMAIILSLPEGNLKYWSKDALVNLYIGAMELAIEAVEDMKGGKYTRFRNMMKKQIEKFKEFTETRSREWILASIYNEILKSEDKAPLRGFGISNRFGDAIMGDSERQTLFVPNDKLTALANKVTKDNKGRK